MQLAFASAAFLPGVSSATVFERTISVTATRFTSFENTISPYDELSLLLTVIVDTERGLVSSAIDSSTLGYPLQVSYVGSFYDYLQVATTPVSPFGLYVRPGLSEFGFTLTGLGSGNLGPGRVSYSTSDSSAVWYADSVDVKLVSAAVPEPASWAMMILGFAAIGYAMRRKTVLRFV
ncbi:PEPxxWA-CTERM sorting domain-containing protein [Sphingomonas sp. RRHST34]|uniref:PEPxxWA-CTERM sorting domain-containing protein n=1 Tax=Sphingomonas citri TaxID=2862499 RepID=A0ABS7BPE9_9SPHN|nr:PEPxxWA-CTERM sorting domain-containing protein [Sphingomonas citri]MBW6531497.1 PEPxxWA-CTERM sorting domain-containing protein [Sphingomonas citri]